MTAGVRRKRVLPLPIALLLAGCGGGDAAPSGGSLFECDGELVPAPPADGDVLLAEDFATGTEGWLVVTDDRHPLAPEPGKLRASLGREGETTFLTLAGSGALFRLFPVEPATTYEFAGRVRARGLPSPFDGATFWLGEMKKSGSPEEVFGEGDKAKPRHTVTSAAGKEGWQDVRIVFRTTSESHSLIVGNMLGMSAEPLAGEVDFTRLRLTRVPESVYWDFAAEKAVRAAHRGADPPHGWCARRSVGAMVGGEHRPAVLLLPGERLRLHVPVPAGASRLECGLAPWPLDYQSGPELVARVAVEGREVLRAAVPLPAGLAEVAWRDASAELAEWKGRTVTLELANDGARPLVCGAPRVRDAAAPPAGMNLLLISIDTLRADRVGAYGYDQQTTPRLDELARGALVFEDVTTQAPYTLPAHATLFSGQVPRVHGVQDLEHGLAAHRSPLLARILQQRGYRTRAFTAGGFLVPDYGFAQGFDEFSIVDPLRHDSAAFRSFRGAVLKDQVSASFVPEPGKSVREWLDRHSREAFFLFVHTFEVHEYDAPPESLRCAEHGCPAPALDYHKFLLNPKRQAPPDIGAVERAHLGHLYDGALRHVDRVVGELLDELARLGLAERTIVVVTADHGEELFERGFLQHGKTLYEELTRVPLIVRIPGTAPRRIATPVGLVDVLPTLLGALGIPGDARAQGIDVLHGPRATTPWSEVHDANARKSALRDARGWKLIHSPLVEGLIYPVKREWELYDLTSDPGETRERSADSPAELARLQAELRAFEQRLAELEAQAARAETEAELEEGRREELEHLGYGGEGGN